MLSYLVDLRVDVVTIVDEARCCVTLIHELERLAPPQELQKMIVVRVVNYQVLELSERSILAIEDVVRESEMRGHELSVAAFHIRSLFVATKEIVEEPTNVLRIAGTDHESEPEKAVQVMLHELHLWVEK